MSFQTEIVRLRNSKTSIKNAIEAKGVTVPSNARISDYAGYIEQLGPYEDDMSLVKTLMGDPQLTLIEIPDAAQVTKTADYLFGKIGFNAVTKVILPSTLQQIGTGSFSKVGGNNLEVDATKCTQLTTLLTGAFKSIKGVLDLRNTKITTIPDTCFNYVYLTSIVFPSTLTSFVNKSTVFSDNSTLTSLTFFSTTPPTIISSTFSPLKSLQHIYVPAESVDTYKTANNWSRHASKISAIQS